MSIIMYKNGKVLTDSMCYLTIAGEVKARTDAKKMFLSPCGRMLLTAVGKEFPAEAVARIFAEWGPKLERFYMCDRDPTTLALPAMNVLRKQPWFNDIIGPIVIFTKYHAIGYSGGISSMGCNELRSPFSIGSAEELAEIVLREDMGLEEAARAIGKYTSLTRPPFDVCDLSTLNDWEMGNDIHNP